MSHTFVFLVGTKNDPRPDWPHSRSRHIATLRGWSIVAVEGTPGATAAALRHRIVTKGGPVTGALLPAVPVRDDMVFLLLEFWDRLVVHESLASLLGDELAQWQRVHSIRDRQVIVLAPVPMRATSDGSVRVARVEGPGAYRETLRSPQPVVCRTSIEGLQEAEQDWFGELAETGLGGSIALITISSEDAHNHTIDLRNPAALGMVVLDDSDAIASVIRARRVRAVGAWGVSFNSDSYGGLLKRLAQMCTHDAVASAVNQLKKDSVPTAYGVLLGLAAPVDPQVRIPRGVVVQQQVLSRVQTLATASQRTVVVGPSAIVPVVIPAWCLNRSLAPPDGQEVRPTGLRLHTTADLTQDAVWDFIRARLEATRQ